MPLAMSISVAKSASAKYGLTSDDSHYLTCLNCGTSVPVEACLVHSLEEKLGQSSHFQIFYHTLEFFGLCAPCTGRLETESPVQTPLHRQRNRRYTVF